MTSGQKIALVALGLVMLAFGVVLVFIAFNRRARKVSEETVGELRYGGQSLHNPPAFIFGGGALILAGLGIAAIGAFG